MTANHKYSMRINEISKSDIKQFGSRGWRSPSAIRHFLAKEGYKELGSGAFGEAWAKPRSKFVIKISRREDECYLRFAHWAMKQKNNPYIPKIKFLKTYRGRAEEIDGSDDAKLFITAIERLNELREDYKLKDFTWTHRQLPMLAWMSHTLQKGEFDNQFIETYKNTFPNVEPAQMVRDMRKYNEKFKSSKMARTYNEIRMMFATTCGMDLHLGNMMMRPGTKQIVFTDPAAFWQAGKGEEKDYTGAVGTGMMK